MKVLYIVSTLKRTGPTNQLLNIVTNLPLEMTPRVLTLSPEPEDSLWQSFEEAQIDVNSLNLSRIQGLFQNKSVLSGAVNRFQPEVIHTQGIRADGLVASMKTSAKKVATLRNFPQLDYPMTYGSFLGKMMCQYHIRQLRRFDRVAGVSDAVSANLADHFSVRQVSTVRNGVNTERFFPVDQGEKQALRAELGLSSGVTLWVCTGHLSPRKNPLELIEAWKQVFANDSSQQLLFLGNGPDMESCQLAIAGMSNVQLIGRTSRVADYLKAADLYVSPSTAEGMPNAVLEAMACGLPVLLSDIDPHKEIISLNSGVGVTYPLGDSTSLADILEQFAIIERSDMVEAVKFTIENFLSASAMSAQYQAVYKELLGEVQ